MLWKKFQIVYVEEKTRTPEILVLLKLSMLAFI
jgi:hypothetical protein